MPLFAIEPVEWRPPDPAQFDALLLTSANAIRCGGPALDRLKPLARPLHRRSNRGGGARGGLCSRGRRDRRNRRAPQAPAGTSEASAPRGTHRREPDAADQSILPLAVYCATELPVPAHFGAIEGAVVALHSPRAASALCRHADGGGPSPQQHRNRRDECGNGGGGRAGLGKPRRCRAAVGQLASRHRRARCARTPPNGAGGAKHDELGSAAPHRVRAHPCRRRGGDLGLGH